MNNTNRRDFLRNISLLTAGGLLAGNGVNTASAAVKSTAQRGRKSYGLQTYSLSQEIYQGDLAANMKRIYDMGYNYLELAGYNQQNGTIGQVPMADFKKAAADAGLDIRCSHLSPPVRGAYTSENRAEIGEFWKKAADDHAKIGVKLLVQPSLPSSRNIPEVKLVCDVFNDAGRISKAAGLSWGYHNHSNEFAWISPDSESSSLTQRAPQAPRAAAPAGEGGAPAGGAGARGAAPAGGGAPGGGGAPQQQPSPYVQIETEFLNNTDPSLVFFEFDVYWAVMGFQDPLEWMRKYANRYHALHIKDREVLGASGMMNFEQIFKQAYTNNINHFFVELERVSSGTQFDGVKGCADYLNAAPFVR